MDDESVSAIIGKSLDHLDHLGVRVTAMEIARPVYAALWAEDFRYRPIPLSGGLPTTFRGIPFTVEDRPPTHPPDYYTDNPPR